MSDLVNVSMAHDLFVLLWGVDPENSVSTVPVPIQCQAFHVRTLSIESQSHLASYWQMQ